MKHDPRLTNPQPTLGSKSAQRKSRMAAEQTPKKDEPKPVGKSNWLGGLTVEMMLGRSKR